MAALTDAELASDLAQHRATIANRDTSVGGRMASMKAEKAIQQELDRRATARRSNQVPRPPVQPFDLDTFEREHNWTRD